MAAIDKIVVNNVEYDITDSTARTLIESLSEELETYKKKVDNLKVDNHEVINGNSYKGTSELDSSKVYFVTEKQSSNDGLDE